MDNDFRVSAAAFAPASACKPVIASAIIPVAGLGTRMLPLTNATAKNMLAIGLKPLIQYAVEEAVTAGCRDIHIICNPAEVEIYKNHFNLRPDIAAKINQPGKETLKDRVNGVTCHGPLLNFLIQETPRGLGHAVAMARECVTGPFAVILPDDLILDGIKTTALKEMVESYQGGIAIAAMPVAKEDTSKYGIFSFAEKTQHDRKTMQATSIVEKPRSDMAPSTMAAIGRYILPPQVMDELMKTSPGAGGEIQLTDAIDRVREQGQALNAVRFSGRRFDCGDPAGFLQAQNDVSRLLLAQIYSPEPLTPPCLKK